jgi:argininosuccinate synthase
MTTKLTLRLDDKLIAQAKKTARAKGVSLSRIVEDYFRSLVARKEKETPESPVLTEISGVLSSSAVSKKFRAEYRKHLEEKYK